MDRYSRLRERSEIVNVTLSVIEMEIFFDATFQILLLRLCWVFLPNSDCSKDSAQSPFMY